MFRALRLAAVLLLLAACDRPHARAPFVESRAPAGLATRQLPPEGWAWGVVQVGQDPAQRYGVASPAVVPRGDVVIVPGYGETAEMWFETVHDLEDAGLTVWVLDRAGQGGSARFVEPRDLGHAPSFDPDVRALSALVRQVVRPARGRPLTLIAQADGAVVALRALQGGLAADRLVLSAPRLATPSGASRSGWVMLEAMLSRDDAPPNGWKPWSRASAGHGQTWQLVNPDLRMAGPSRGWKKAFAAASAMALGQAGGIRTPALEIGRVSGPDPCPRLPDCRRAPPPSSDPASARTAWLTAVTAFARAESPLGVAEPAR